MNQLLQEHVPSPNGRCNSQQNPFFASVNPLEMMEGAARMLVLAYLPRMRQSTPGKGYTDTMLPQQVQEASNQTQVFHSISVVTDRQQLETIFSPEFVYQCADILTDLYRSSGRVLLGERLSIYQW